MRVRALVDVEVVVRGERRHPQVDGVRRPHLLEGLAGQPLEDLPRRRLDVEAHRLDRAREVVVRREVAADELEDRLHLLADGREDELVAPDRVPAELALVRLHPLGDEPPAAIARPQRRGDDRGVVGRERGTQLGVVADLVLHPPEGLDRVPVPVGRRVLESSEQRLVDRAAGLLHDRPQVEGRRQLGEVEHPVDLPVSVVDVDGVLEQARRVGQVHRVGSVEPRLEEREVALHLGAQAVAPPVREVPPVDRQDGVEIGAHRGRERGVAWHTRPIAGAVLGRVDAELGIGRDGGRVDVAVDVLRQPVDRERGAEPAEHVVAAQPPAADIEEHRADRVRAMEVVVDPEEVLLDLGIPGDGERRIAEELAEDLLCRRHAPVLQGGKLSIIDYDTPVVPVRSHEETR